MIVDTDVLINYFCGYKSAITMVRKLNQFSITAITYMELVQGIKNKTEMRLLKNFISENHITYLPLTEEITARAIYFLEIYSLTHGICLADALIAATADIRGETLCTGNLKHYKFIKNITLKPYKP